MALTRRRKVILILLLFYWPAIFVLTHLPKLPKWVFQSQMSDKTLHFIAYLALAFLWWLTLSPYKKVNWRKPAVWWTLAIMVWYGAFDEWLQHYVNRTPDLYDFIADLAGALTSLVILSIFTFWSASLIVTAVTVFVITNLSSVAFFNMFPIINSAFHFCAYAFFTMLWLQNMHRSKHPLKPGLKYLIKALIFPVLFLFLVKAYSVVVAKTVSPFDIATAITAIFTTAVISLLTILTRQRYAARFNHDADCV